MKIYLLRHGIAADHGDPRYPRDSERPLTPEGRRKTRLVANALGKLGVKPDIILTSPFVRAHQTAEITATVLRLKKRLQVCQHLASGGDAKRLIAEISKSHGRAESVMLVGHEPDLSQLASLLISGKPDGAMIELKKGGLCVLETDTLRAGKCATLLWLAPPKVVAES
jgi:phosphohistidine phosphatase